MRLIKDAIKRLLANFGYDLSASPRALVEHPSARLSANLDLVFSHYFLQKPDFFFVQVGACDGIFADQFHHYVTRYSLKGILVEPQKDMYAALERNYAGNRNLRLLNLAIAKQDGETYFYRVKKQYLDILPYARGLSSLKKDRLELGIKTYLAELPKDALSLLRVEDLIECDTVNCATLNTMLIQQNIRVVDLLLIDTEGFDFEIIKTIDFARWRPAIIQFEHSHFSTSDTNSCYELLIQNDYLLSRGSSDTVAYAREHYDTSNSAKKTAAQFPGGAVAPLSALDKLL